MTVAGGYWPSRWPGEDGGPTRRQVPRSGDGFSLGSGTRLDVTSRLAPLATMVVLRDPGEVYLLRHGPEPDAVSFVEQIDPLSLEPLRRSVDLAGGPLWPGGIAAHANGSLYVVFGNHAHRLDPDLNVLATCRLPRPKPYNSFLILPDGCLATKDFAGLRPGAPVTAVSQQRSELVVLEPEGLDIVARCDLTEPSIARLSADSNQIYAVGDTSLVRVGWDGIGLTVDTAFSAPYRLAEGQTYGWDCVIALGAAWFLDNGEGSDRYNGSLVGLGISEVPLHLVRIDLASGQVSMSDVCGLPGGLVANPPVIDEQRNIAVGYDSANGVLAAFDVTGGSIVPRWSRTQNHGSHLLLFPDTGELVTGDFDLARGQEQVVVLDIATGEELARADTGSPVQSVLFPATGFDRDLYLCSFTTVSRVAPPD